MLVVAIWILLGLASRLVVLEYYWVALPFGIMALVPIIYFFLLPQVTNPTVRYYIVL